MKLIAKNKLDIIYIFCLALGLALFLYSVISAVLFHNDRFYTSFALGSFLLLSYINYKKTGTSMIKFFFFEAKLSTILLFVAASTLSFFIVDYYYGVQLSGMWKWSGYGFVDYIFMFVFMNFAFILGMYELFVLIMDYLRKYIHNENILVMRDIHAIYRIAFIFGIVFIMFPIIYLFSAE